MFGILRLREGCIIPYEPFERLRFPAQDRIFAHLKQSYAKDGKNRDCPCEILRHHNGRSAGLFDVEKEPDSNEKRRDFLFYATIEPCGGVDVLSIRVAAQSMEGRVILRIDLHREIESIIRVIDDKARDFLPRSVQYSKDKQSQKIREALLMCSQKV